jgi:hypothetical protein
MKYIGIKIVDAEADNSEVAPGEALPGYRVKNPDGMVTWWPKEDFEQAFRPADGMSFGMAIEAAKKGMRIARKGWNGKGMWVFLAESEELNTAADLSSLENDDGIEVGAFFVMKTAQGGLQPGWLASQADMLAEDWVILEDVQYMGWPQAEEAMKSGGCIRRRWWSSTEFVALIEEPAELRGKVCRVDGDGEIEQDWEPDPEDLKADDWYIVPVEE